MKKYYGAITLMLLFLIAINICMLGSKYVAITNEQKKLFYGKTIFIDAGHGGSDPGKVEGDVKESEINLEFSTSLGKALTSMGAKVVYSRKNSEGITINGNEWDKDMDMSERVRMFEESGCDVVLSIHQNSYSDTSCQGPQVFYKNNEDLAKIMQTSLNSASPYQKKRTQMYREDLFILKNTTRPIVILELAFLSNEEDLAKIHDASYKAKLVDAIISGLNTYLKK